MKFTMPQKLLILAILFAGLSVAIMFYVDKPTTDCGIIRVKESPTELQFSKYSGHLEVHQYFIVEFEKRGMMEIKPTRVDFYTHEVGDRVCYTYNERRHLEKGWLGIVGIFSAIIGVVLAIAALVIKINP